jgi:hypothetical protein
MVFCSGSETAVFVEVSGSICLLITRWDTLSTCSKWSDLMFPGGANPVAGILWKSCLGIVEDKVSCGILDAGTKFSRNSVRVFVE